MSGLGRPPSTRAVTRVVLRVARRLLVASPLVALLPAAALLDAAASAESAVPAGAAAWWVWPSVLFAASLGFGIVAVLGGLGGGTIFVPIVGGFFPFHLDFVRAAGLLVALSGALAAGPELLRTSLADLRLAIPIALVASASAVAGAKLGLAWPTSLVQMGLGLVVLAILVAMALSREPSVSSVETGDALSRALGIGGSYHEASLGRQIEWTVRRTWLGLVCYVVVGLMAGLFGIGAGWANVAVLNLVMGAPLKVAVGTSIVVLSITDTAAAWVYLHHGAVLPMLVVPSVVGVMIGSRIGVKILARAKPRAIRRVIVVILAFAGARALLKGAGTWP